MRRKITLFVFTCLIARCCSQVTKCDIDDTEGILGWDTAIIAAKPINDNDVLDLKFAYRGDLQVEPSTEEEGAKYIDITADGSTFSIKTNDYFTNNYEENQKNQPAATSLTIYRTLSITCDGETYPFTLGLYVQDTNNHAPTFTQNTYTYTMPMPLVPNIDLTNFGEIEIIAEDIDFSNTKMTFTVQPTEYFDLDFKALASRQYHAVLKVTQYVRYDKDLTLTITATDETEPFHNVTATVVIKKDTEFSQPDIPTFSELIYAFTYSNDGGNPAITPDDPSKQIVVTTSDSDQTEVSLSDETYFKAEYDKATKIVAISVTDKPVESASESMMTLTLTVKLGSESSESAIIVKLPSNVVVIIPKFTAPYYTATYSVDGDGNPSLALDAGQEIAITQQASNLDIKLEGDPHFSIANVDGVWTLNADSPLEDEILKKGEDITLTLHATVTDENSEEHEGFGVVIVKLPPVLEVPRFVEANYRGQYKVDEAGVKDTVELTNGPIKIVQTDETVEIGIVDSDGHFTLIQDSEAWTVDVLKNWEQVTEGGNIVLTLSATVTGADVEPGYSTLIIDLPAATEAPTFDKPYYTATYKTDTDPNTLEMTDTINVAGGDGTVVNFLDSENSDCFSISCDDGTHICQVTLVKDLPDDVITQGDDVILNIEASQPDSTETGLSILIISLETVIPKFSKAYYRAKYDVDENNNGVVTMIEQNITIDSPQDQAVDVAFSEVTDNFGLQQDPSNDHQWTVTVIQNLPDDVLQSGEDLILSLEAHIPGSPSSIVTTETLIIELPAVVTTPKFLNAIYSAEYESNGDENTVTLSNGPIQLTATENINVVFVDTYSENFDFTLDADPQITVKKPLGDDVISQYQEVLLTLQVSLEGSTDDVETTVIELKLPHLDIPKTLKFNNPSFVFSYIVEGDTHSIDQKGQTIRVTNGEMAAAVSIMEGTHSDNFKVRRNDEDDTYSIIIAKNLEQSVIDSEVDILLVLDASLALVYDDFATVLINLPAKDAGIPPQFKNTFYVGNYVLGEEKDGVDTFVIDGDQISLNDGISEEVSVTLAGTNSKFFDVVLNTDKTVTVNVKDNLDLKTILGDVDIVLTLQATDPAVTEVGTAVVVVELPKEVTPAAFTQAYYTGSYDVDSDPDDITINEAIELSGNYLDSTKVALATPAGLEDKFKLSDASPYTITLTSDINDVHSYNEIVLTLEASIDGVSRKTSATVVIEVPAIPLPPKFSSPLYEFKYDSDTVTSTDGKKITTEPSGPSVVSVVIGDSYVDNFKISYDQDAGEYKFEVTTPLDQTTIDQNVEIFVQLDATLTGSTDTSSATVAIKMPEKTENVVPKFSNAYYKATYTHNDPDEDIVTIQDPVPITIASDQASDTVVNVIGQYQENFKAEFNTDTNSWGIKVTSKLDDTALSLLELVIPLEAVLTGAADVGSAALVLSLPDSEKDPIPLFEKPSYTAQYSLKDDGTPDVTGDPIVVKVADLTYAEVTLADYTDYFVLTPNGDKSQWIISSSSKTLDDDTLKNNLELVIQLNAHLDSAVADGAAVLVVTLPHQSITFDAPKYQGAYKHDSEDSTKDSVVIADITIQPAGASAAIQNNAYPDNFDIQCDDEGKCNLQLKAPLEDTVLTSEKEIILVLEASKEDTAATSTATVIISLPLLETLDAPEFTENVYVAPYVVDEETGEITINPDNPIQIKGETNLTGFELIPDGENVDHFAFIKKEDHWDVTNSKPLPDETLKNDVSILLNLKVTKLGVSVPGLAGLVIQLPKSTDPEILSFTQVAYIANYTVVTGNNNDVLDITNGPVKFDGVDDASTVKPDVVEDEYKDYFSITPETDGWTIAMLKDFSSEITDQISLTVTLKATLDDRSGECALVISLPKKVSPASFQFEFPTYRAEYEQDQDGNYKVSFEKSITLTGDAKDVTVDIDGDYATYFVETKTGNTVSIELNKDLPDDVLDKVAITLDIVASKSNEKATSTAVINLPRKVVPSSFYFDSGVYTGTYNEDDTFALDSDQKISLKGDIDHTATFAANGDYAGYFAVSYDGEEITVTLTKPLPSEVVEEKITIPVGIVATREGVDTPTTLVVKLPKNSAPATFYFEHSVYTVQYIDDDDSLVQPDINIEGDSDNKASVKLISSDYAKYFDAGYTNGAVKLTVKEPITDEIIAEKGAITVDLEATSPSDEVATATVVIELPKRNTAATFYFDSTIYEASYNDDGVTVNGSITLTGDSDSTATVEVQGEYADDFTVTYTDNTVELSLTKTLPSDVLDTYAAITVDIVATKGSETATTTVVITLPKKIVPASFSFNSTHYVGDYKVDDNGNTLAVSAISLKGETENVKVTLEGEYSDHFSVGYASGNVNITLKKPLDSDILDTKSAIPLDLKAVKADETVITTLVITLPKEASVGDSEDDKTGLIAAVAVLAVLLVASLVGSAVFYYFKFRRGSSYNDIDEGRPSERFRKNSTTDSKKVEHPTRRATGVIKYPLEEVAENGETPTEEMEPNLEKRKSVQFDTINIDELEIEKPEDDDNDFMGDSEAEDGDDTRRTSRV